MKKIKTLFVLFMLMHLVVGAQKRSRTTLKHDKPKTQHELLVRTLTGQQNTGKHAAAKSTTEIAERLKAQTDYGFFADSVTFEPVWGLLDSFRFNYSGDRSSYFNYNYMKYYNTYEINGAGIFGFGSSVGFQDHNDLPDMLSDTSYFWQQDAFTLAYGLDEVRYSIYDTNNNITDFADYYASGIGWRYVNTYDAYTNIETSMAYEGDSTAWDSSEYRFFIYDGSHRLVMDSTNEYMGGGAWQPEEKYLYTYDGYGNITQVDYYGYDPYTGEWGEDYRYVMTYYTGNKIKTLEEYMFDTTAPVINKVDSFGWTPGLNYVTYHKEAEYSFGNLMDYTVYTKHISADSLPDTMYYTLYDNTDVAAGSMKTVYLYDSYSEPTLATTYLYNDSTGAYDSLFRITHYYYEGYAKMPHHSAVTSTTVHGNVTIYPNPATGELNIYMPDVPRGTQVLVRMTNVSGQTVRTESLNWNNKTEQLPMNGLVPGTYWLFVQDRAGNVLSRQSVVKQ